MAMPILSLLVSCADPEPQLRPETASVPGIQQLPDTGWASGPQRVPSTASTSQSALPSGYTLGDTTDWHSMLEEGRRAMLRRAGATIDTVDLTFGVAVVGKDSLVFLPVRTDTLPIAIDSVVWYESFPTQHVLWTPVRRRELSDLLPFFNANFSSPTIARESVIYYWGIAPHDTGSSLYAIRYDFRTARLDSLSLNREDRLATDYRYHLGLPQVRDNEVSFDGVVLDRTTWRIIRQDPPSN